jgi:hypothetical protein
MLWRMLLLLLLLHAHQQRMHQTASLCLQEPKDCHCAK